MYFTQIILNSFVTGTQVLFMAAALYIVYAAGKIFHIALGAISTAIAYTFWLCIQYNISILASILASVAVAITLSIISYVLLEDSIQKKQPLFAFLLSFSFATALESIISITFGSNGKLIWPSVLPTVTVKSIYLTFPAIVTLVGGIFTTATIIFVLKTTPFGRTLKSISSNASHASSLGINTKRIRLIAYIIASIFVGIISILIGINTSITPTMGFHTITLAFIALLIGGTTDIKGVILASYIITIIPSLIISYSTNMSQIWNMVLVFIIAGICLTFRQNGLFTKTLRKN